MNPECNSKNFKVLCHKERKSVESANSADKNPEPVDPKQKPGKDPKATPGEATPKDENDGCIKKSEFFSVLQDLDHKRDITIVRETVIEETRNHSVCSGGPTANRYRFCREVIKPYLDPNDCPKTKEQLVQKLIDSAEKDFFNDQPCFGSLEQLNKDGSEPEKPKPLRYGLSPKASCPDSSPIIICREEPCCDKPKSLYDAIICKYKPADCKLAKNPCCPPKPDCGSEKPPQNSCPNSPVIICPGDKKCPDKEASMFDSILAKLNPFDCEEQKPKPCPKPDPCCEPKKPCCPPDPCPPKPSCDSPKPSYCCPKPDLSCPAKKDLCPPPKMSCPPDPCPPKPSDPCCPPKKPCCPKKPSCPKKPDPCCKPRDESTCPNEPPIPSPNRGKGPSLDQIIDNSRDYVNVDAHKDTVCTIKTAVKDAMCKVATTSKKTVNESETMTKALAKTGEFISDCSQFVREKAESLRGSVCKSPKDPSKSKKVINDLSNKRTPYFIENLNEIDDYSDKRKHTPYFIHNNEETPENAFLHKVGTVLSAKDTIGGFKVFDKDVRLPYDKPTITRIDSDEESSEDEAK